MFLKLSVDEMVQWQLFIVIFPVLFWFILAGSIANYIEIININLAMNYLFRGYLYHLCVTPKYCKYCLLSLEKSDTLKRKLNR